MTSRSWRRDDRSYSRPWTRRAFLSLPASGLVAIAMAGPARASEDGPPPLERAWVTPPVSAPGVAYATVMSPIVGARVSFHVYLPPDYAANPERRYPTLYWLHGTGGGQRGIPVIAGLFDAAIRNGLIPPMILVFPNGLPEGMWTDSADGLAPVETLLVRDLVPHIDGNWRTIPSRHGRMLEGFSMGGYGAARIGFRHVDLFASISMLAAGPLDQDFKGPRAVSNPVLRKRILSTVFGDDIAVFRAQSPWVIAAETAPTIRTGLHLRQVVGSEDFSVADNRAFHLHLDRLEVPHEYRELAGVGHDPRGLLMGLGEDNWRFYRTAFAGLTPGIR
jgi:enterochelin esterase-like enzyme